MKRIRDRVAGLDVNRDTVVACVRVTGGDGEVAVSRRRFKTTAAALAELADWLARFEITTVGMEATGIYWRPVYYRLEGHFPEVWLCNAAHVKNVPGRKTDLSDAEWLADVVAHGMVRPSFVAPLEVREAREINRYRRSQVKARAAEILRLEKVLQDAGIKLTSVASKVWTKSTVAMVEALIAGQREPAQLAELAKGKLRPKIPELADALAGTFGPHHAVLAREILDHIAYLDRVIARLDDQLVERLRPFEPAMILALGVPGIGPEVARAAVTETGAAMAPFPTGGHFASWLGLCPHNRESAGKHKAAGSGHGNPTLRQALLEAAHAASHTNTYLGARYRRIARRRGPNKAAVAVAHSMAVILWHLWTTGQTYQDPGPDYFNLRHSPQHQARHLIRQLENLGYHVDINAA